MPLIHPETHIRIRQEIKSQGYAFAKGYAFAMGHAFAEGAAFAERKEILAERRQLWPEGI